MRKTILIVDDEKSICTFLAIALEDEFETVTVNTSKQAIELLDTMRIHLVLLDLMLGKEYGLDLLTQIKERHSAVPVIMMTAYGDINTSVEAIKRGAFQYICKPVNIEELKLYANQAMEYQDLSRRVESLSTELKELEQRTYYGDIIGKSEPMQRIYQLIDKVKDVDSSIVITGESGTGKELVARAIHKNGPRAKENFVSINCAAIPEGLMEEEFFGHIKGSFTGAMSDSKGKLELADHGTLFLDEVGDMPLFLQSKLLRVLQEKEMMPIGGNSYKKIDVRVICATNRNLMAMVQEGAFRNDLYYRLNVIHIHVPPLRERKQDIPELSENILKRLAKNMKRSITGFTPEAERFLLEYNYPGNVRELINLLEYACILCNGTKIDVGDFPEDIHGAKKSSNSNDLTLKEIFETYLKGMSMQEVERLLVQAALKEHPQNNRAAAQQLGISERSLYNKIKEFNL